MKKQNITVTRELLLQNEEGKAYIHIFDRLVAKDECLLSELLKKCEEAEKFLFANFLIKWAGRNPEPWVIDAYAGWNIFYNGELHIKKMLESSGNIICKKLKVDGRFVVGRNRYVWVDFVDAEEIDLMDKSMLSGRASTYAFNTYGAANLHGFLEIKHR